MIYNVYNLPENFSDEEINYLYYHLASKIGLFSKCHPVNDKNTIKSFSRHIKYDPDATTLHYFSSNCRQPLHNDYAYYEINNSPDWLVIFALQPAEYGGVTSVITNNKIKTILQKYDNNLLEDINLQVNYLYNDVEIGDVKHSKQLFESKTNIINWNYYQIKNELNSEKVNKIKEDFFTFLNSKISQANI